MEVERKDRAENQTDMLLKIQPASNFKLWDFGVKRNLKIVNLADVTVSFREAVKLVKT